MKKSRLCEQIRAVETEPTQIWCQEEPLEDADAVADALRLFFDFYSDRGGSTIRVAPSGAEMEAAQGQELKVGRRCRGLGLFEVMCPLMDVDVQRSTPGEWAEIFGQIRRAAEHLRPRTCFK